MAVSSVSSSSSIYGTRNVITGLASGMDTESMIENIISSYKTKIATLTQKRTKVEWQQEAYRSIISKLSTFTDKYASYQSANNLMSNSFFDSAVKTVSLGANASKVTATGRASSNIQVDRVKQLATAATYKLSGTALDAGTSAFGSGSVTMAAGDTLDLDEKMTLSAFSGSMTLAYGGSSALSRLTINFDETTTYANAQEVADEINRQLKEQTITIGTSSYTGDDLLNKVLKAEVGSDGTIRFSDPKNNNVYISSASPSIMTQLLGMSSSDTLSSTYDEQVKSLKVTDSALKTTEKSTLDYLSEKGATMSITLDGVTKSIKLPTATDIKSTVARTAEERDADYVAALQKNIDAAFGAGKLTVSDKNGGEAGIQLQFDTAQNGSTFTVSSTYGESLGFGDTGALTSYLNTNKTLGELLDADKFAGFEKAYVERTDANGNKYKELAKDSSGNQLYSFRVNGVEIGQFNENSKLSEVINAMNSNSESGVKVNYSKLTNELTFTAKETGEANGISFSNPAGVSGTSMAAALFGVPGSYDESSDSSYTKGQDAILEVSVNGTSLGEITRSSNNIDLDGMTISLKGTFGYQTDEDGNIKYDVTQDRDKNGDLLFGIYQGNGTEKQITAKELDDGRLEFTDDRTGKKVYGTYDENGQLTFTHQNGSTVYARLTDDGGVTFTEDATLKQDVYALTTKTAVKDNKAEAVTFETSSDADKLVDIIKQMVEDYNAMATEIKNAYSTLPLQQSSGAYYEPLTDEDMEGMSESTITAWEEKAKTGLLFGDTALANLYKQMTAAISLNGEYGATLRSAGITVSYANGLSTLSFEEDKFRAALNEDPDAVRDAFTASTENGAKSNGLMQSLKIPLDTYGKTTGGKGILVEYAGSPLAASTLYSNSLQTQLNKIDEQISDLQDKMNDQVDVYTSKFSRLEQLIQQMNSQSSYFSQLMGGY